jgi:hypothetical protein
MGRWLVLVAFPILICTLIFQAILVPSEDAAVNFFFVGGHSYGAPFPVGAAPFPGIPVNGPAPTPPESFSVVWFAVDVVVTAAITFVIALLFRTRNAWPPAVIATFVIVLFMTQSWSAPIPFRSYGFSFWIYWLVAFALTAAIWTLLSSTARVSDGPNLPRRRSD